MVSGAGTHMARGCLTTPPSECPAEMWDHEWMVVKPRSPTAPLSPEKSSWGGWVRRRERDRTKLGRSR